MDHCQPSAQVRTDFQPLRLVLQPDSIAVELRRPDMVVGRHSQADVRLPLPDVSRRHCRFVFQDGTWHVWDMKSLNGVYINNERVEHAVVHDGDQLRLGAFVFEIRVGDAAHASPDADGDDSATAAVLTSIARALPGPALQRPERKAS